MKDDRVWLGWIVRVVCYVGLTATAALTPRLDLERPASGDLFTEDAFLETAELIAMILPAALLILVGLRFASWLSISFVMALLLGCAIVRELDHLLDRVFDGLWQLSVSFLLAVAAWLIWRDRHNFFPRLRRYADSMGFGLMLAGFLTSTVFSRLFGKRTFWEAVMGEGYIRSVKNVAEETLELLGYTLILIGVVEFYLWLRRISRS